MTIRWHEDDVEIVNVESWVDFDDSDNPFEVYEYESGLFPNMFGVRMLEGERREITQTRFRNLTADNGISEIVAALNALGYHTHNNADSEPTSEAAQKVYGNHAGLWHCNTNPFH